MFSFMFQCLVIATAIAPLRIQLRYAQMFNSMLSIVKNLFYFFPDTIAAATAAGDIIHYWMGFYVLF